MNIDNNYKNIVQKVLEEGYLYNDPNRKNVKRLEIPSYTFRHNFSDGFPAISTKKLAWKSVVTELIWFLKGDTNIKYLVDNGCNIWNKDAYNYYIKQFNPEDRNTMPMSIERFIELVKDNRVYEKSRVESNNYKLGDLGKVYGYFWRNFNGVDQIKELIKGLKEKPLSARHYVSAWDPSLKENQALPPCHYGFQIVTTPLENNQIGFELHWNQMSCDLFLGIPFNIASYALLALILEKITGHKALGIQGDLKKVHLYDNSIEAAKEQLSRKCSEELVTVEFDNPSYKEGTKFTDIDMFLDELYPEYFELKNYNPQPAIKVEMLERR